MHCAVLQLRRVLRGLRRYLSRGAVILLYHRVAAAETDPYLLSVPPDRFAEQMEVLQRYARPMGLPQLVEALRKGAVPPRAVAVTFDDGYADNLYTAKPILERFGIPATVFVSAGFLGAKFGYWWDELELILLRPGNLPRMFCFNVDGEAWQVDAGDAARYGQEDYQRHRSWIYCEHDLPTPRHRLFVSFYARLRRLPREQQSQVLDQLRTGAGFEAIGPCAPRPLTDEELCRLGDGDLVEIGGHTMYHLDLTSLETEEQRDEIVRGKESLERIAGGPVRMFAYPYGVRGEQSARLLEEARFCGACTTRRAVLCAEDDRYDLPRMMPGSSDGEGLLEWLDYWFRR